MEDRYFKIHGNVFAFLSQFVNDMDEDIPDHLKCYKCRQFLINPYQTLCGCRYCRKCLDEMTKNGYSTCPGLSDDCRFGMLENIFIDYSKTRELMELLVGCPNDQCPVKCELMHLPDHMKSCVKKRLKPQLLIPNSSLPMEDNDNEIRLIALEIEEKDKIIMSVFDKIKIIKTEIASLSEKLKTFNLALEEKFAPVKSQIEQTFDRITVEENANKTKLKTQIKKLQMNAKSKTDDTRLIWEINNLENKSEYINSEYFYVRYHQYKLRLKLMNAVESLLIYLCVYAGSNYKHIKWPFQGKVTIEIVNKSSRQVIKKIVKDCKVDMPEFGSYQCSDIFIIPNSDLLAASIYNLKLLVLHCLVDVE